MRRQERGELRVCEEQLVLSLDSKEEEEEEEEEGEGGAMRRAAGSGGFRPRV